MARKNKKPPRFVQGSWVALRRDCHLAQQLRCYRDLGPYQVAITSDDGTVTIATATGQAVVSAASVRRVRPSHRSKGVP